MRLDAGEADIRDGRIAIHGHEEISFHEDRLQDVRNTVSAAESQAVDIRPADADCPSAQGQGLDNVRSAPNTGIGTATGASPAAVTTVASMSIAGTPPLAYRPPWLEQ